MELVDMFGISEKKRVRDRYPCKNKTLATRSRNVSDAPKVAK